VQIDEIVDDLLNRFNHLVVKKSWGETSLFFNPKGASAHGSYFVTIKESDGENDKASNLDRSGIFRVSFGLSLQVLNPSHETWNSNQNLIQESYGLSKARFEKR